MDFTKKELVASYAITDLGGGVYLIPSVGWPPEVIVVYDYVDLKLKFYSKLNEVRNE